jgi:TP901 family phage tail tape measure protein
MQSINATGKFVASQKEIATSTASFTSALEKNQLSMRQYFRYTAAAATANTKTFKGMFAQEREIINRARKDRVKLLQSQYIQLGNANGDLVKVLQVVPKHLQMTNGRYTDYATRVQMAAQRQQFLNQLLKQGSTNLLNFGKNTQWAGRQLMVGLTIPLSILGSAAAKTFMEMEEAVLKFTRVYGDITTSGDATNKAVADIQRLGREFTKYGIAVKDTMEMAATAAAMGMMGDALESQVVQATRLSVLGQVEQQQALETTISLQNAFGVSSEQLAQKINFLNAVENQTVLSIEDLTIAIPKAGPVVKQLGGSVEDLAFFMTAMKEGGINASEGANALKSGLASIINPAKKTSEFLAEMGINIKGIVDNNAGNLKGTVVGLARALDTLDPLNRSRAIEQLFGKFQFARISTLFQNIVKDGTQASRALDLAGASVEELAILSERELKRVEDSTGAKFKKAMENLKNELIPVGKAFLEAITPIVGFVGKLLAKFNGLSDGTKKAITIMIGVLGAIAPVALMTFGILANGLANIIKFFAMLRGGIAKLNGQNNVLGGGFDYLTNKQIELLAETNALHTSHQQLISTFNVEKSAVDALALAYQNAGTQARNLAATSPGLFNSVPGPAGAVAGLPKYADGKKAEVVTVGGTGNQDSELALLTPGETVISAPMSDKYGALINAMIDDKIPGYKSSRRSGNPDANWLKSQIAQRSSMSGMPLIDLPTSGAVQGGTFNDATYSVDAMMAPGNNASGPGMDLKWLAKSEEAKASIVSALKVGQMRAEGVRVEYDRYSEFWSSITSELDEIAGIFQSTAVGAASVDAAGKKAFPLIEARIREMEASGRLSAEDAAKLQARTRALLDPAPEDRTASRNRRYDLAIDPETGGEVVKRKGWDGRESHSGPTYNSDPFQQAMPWELEQRGLPVPENYGKYQFAHVADRLEGEAITRPITTRKYRDSSGPTPGEAKLKEMMAAKQDIKEGMQLSTGEELAAWVDAQITNAEQKAETASPSKRTKRLGKDIADGLAQGLEEGQPAVRAQSSRLADAAIPSAAETQSKVSKMDLGNKAFYDDINTPEMRDERQVLKSLDRQRRKRGAKGSVELPAEKTATKTRVSLAKKTQVQSKEIAKETENLANSTVIVAEETDEFANVTQAAVDAQTTNTSNLITTNQLTNAANNNLGEMLPSMDQAGIAQQDIAQSSANIAKTNEEIEAEKRKELDRLKAYNAQEAARQAAENGIVPPGSQSVDNRMGSVEAYEEASTYTRDKNGQILFDPELDADGKKQPTTLSEKQIAQKKRGMRREKVGRVSGKISGAAGTAAMVAGMAGAPPQVVAGLGAVATVAQFAPMLAGLTGPQGIVVALAAVAAGAYLFNKHLNAMAGKAAQFAKDLSATRSGLQAIGEISGKVGASEIMDKRRQSSQYGKYNETTKIDDTFGKQFLGSDPGKKEKALFQQNVKDFGNDKAVSDLALKLSTAVADGVLDMNAANSIASNLALELGDQKIESQIIGQIVTLLGPDGKNLKDSPIETRIMLVAKANVRTDKLENEISQKSGLFESSRKQVAALAALNMNNIEMATMMADQVQFEYETQKKKLETELASTTNAQKKLDIEEKIKKLNTQNVADTEKMNSLIVNQIAKSQASFDKVYSNSVWGKQAMREDAFFDASRSQVESTYKGTDQEDAAKKFLNKTERLTTDTVTGKYNDKTGQYVKTGLGTKQAAQRFQAKMEMLVGSKVLSPGEATSYMDLFTGKLPQLDLLLNAGLKTQGAAKTKELFNMFAGFSSKGRKKAQNIITTIIMNKKDPKEFDAIMETLKGIQSLDGNTIDFEVLVNTIGLEGIETLKTQMDNIEKLKEEAAKKGEKNMDLEAAKAVNPAQAAAIDALKANTERYKEFQKLSLDGQAEYLQKLATQFAYESTVTDAMREADREQLASTLAFQKASADGVAYGSARYLEIVAEFKKELAKLSPEQMAVQKLETSSVGGLTSLGAPVDTTPDGGKGSNPLDFLDDLAMRIKNVRDGAFDATKPLQSMLAAFGSKKAQKDISRAFDLFDGLQQRLINLKAPKEFRDMIASMSSEDFKKLANLKGKKAIFEFEKGKPKTKANIKGFTGTGKKIMRTYNEAIVGEANVVNREAVEQVANQEKAFRILISEGATATEALEHVQDAATAAAIAAGALGKKGSKERKQYIEDLKKATDETERFALKQKMIQANEEFKLLEQMPKLGTAMQAAGFSADQMSEVLNDPALAKHLIEDLKDGKVDAQEIADYLNSIEAKKIIDIQVNYNSGKYSESAQPGMDLVDEMFSVQEEMLRTGADPRTSGMVQQMNANNKQIQDAEIAAKGFRRQIELINREIRDIEKDIEKNYTRPIEEMQEKISDKQRILEMDPEFGDRAMEEINKQNAKMSNDSAIMANQAEQINKEYDKQAEALAKVAEVNEEILNQQKSQLDIAGALTSGDISAAAKAAQDARAQSAQRFSGSVADALQQSRENEIRGLRGAETGLSQEEIDQKQFENSQKLYQMENDPRRVTILQDIRNLEDQIYDLEEAREAKLLEIQKKEDAIFEIQKNQLEPLEDKIADLTFANELIQAQIDKLVSELTVLDKTKLEWDAIKAKIAANSLAGKDFDAVLGALLASTAAIDAKWASILAKLKEYNSTPVSVKNAQSAVVANAAAAAASVAADKAATDAIVGATTDAAAASKAAADAYALAKAAGDMNAAAIAAAGVNPSALASGESGAIGAASIAAQLAAAESALRFNTGLNIIADRRQKFGYISKGGLIPKFFARGGFAKGTDTVPAMLTPGEFVMSKYAVNTHGVDTMKSLNSGKPVGGAVYNNTYTLTVNAKTDANPNEIAQAVMSTIKNVENRRIRGVSLNG